jgi:hypothetical protein
MSINSMGRPSRFQWSPIRTERQLTKDDLLADQGAALAQAKSALVESAATEVVSVGRVLFKDGEPSTLRCNADTGSISALEAAPRFQRGPQRLEDLYKAYRELKANLAP